MESLGVLVYQNCNPTEKADHTLQLQEREKVSESVWKVSFTTFVFGNIKPKTLTLTTTRFATGSKETYYSYSINDTQTFGHLVRFVFTIPQF